MLLLVHDAVITVRYGRRTPLRLCRVGREEGNRIERVSLGGGGEGSAPCRKGRETFRYKSSPLD